MLSIVLSPVLAWDQLTISVWPCSRGKTWPVEVPGCCCPSSGCRRVLVLTKDLFLLSSLSVLVLLSLVLLLLFLATVSAPLLFELHPILSSGMKMGSSHYCFLMKNKVIRELYNILSGLSSLTEILVCLSSICLTFGVFQDYILPLLPAKTLQASGVFDMSSSEAMDRLCSAEALLRGGGNGEISVSLVSWAKVSLRRRRLRLLLGVVRDRRETAFFMAGLSFWSTVGWKKKCIRQD